MAASLASKFPTFSPAERDALAALAGESASDLGLERAALHTLLLAPEAAGFQRDELVALLSHIEGLTKQTANPARATPAAAAERGVGEAGGVITRIAALRRERAVAAGKLAAVRSPETEARGTARGPDAVANELARILAGTMGTLAARLGPHGVVLPLILPLFRPLSDAELASVLAQLLERHPREVPLLVELMNHPDFRAYVLGRPPFYEFVGRHWELSALDVLSFLSGVAFGVLADAVDTLNFVLEIVRASARQTEVVVELMKLVASGRLREAAELVAEQIGTVVEVLRAILRFLREMPQWPEMVKSALAAAAAEFHGRIARFEFFAAGKMLGPIVGLLVGLVVGAVRGGARLGQALVTALPRLRVAALALDAARMRKVLEAFRATLVARAGAAATRVSEAVFPDIGSIGVGFAPEGIFAYATSPGGRAVRRMAFGDVLESARGLAAAAVKLGDDTFSQLIDGLEELPDVRELIRGKGPRKKDLQAIGAAADAVLDTKPIYDRIADLKLYKGFEKQLELAVRYIAALEKRFPKLKEFKLRPTRRPRRGGGEPIWFERMHADQDAFGFGGQWPDSVRKGKNIEFQLDGLLPDGNLLEAKFSELDPKKFDSFREAIELDAPPPRSQRSPFKLERSEVDDLLDEVDGLDPRFRDNPQLFADRMGDIVEQLDRQMRIARQAGLPGVTIAANTEEMAKLLEVLLKQRYGDRHVFTVITPARLGH